MLLSLADHAPSSFQTQADVRDRIRAACETNADVATYRELGESEGGRPLYGVVLGTGPRAVSLVAGNHADEPVGPETLRLFILEGLRQRERLGPLLEAFRFAIVPHTNPDGEARNQAWMEAWPDVQAYAREAVREEPGRDLEFGFPSMRQENRAVAAFLEGHAPFALHMSLHGMAFSEGAMLLVNRPWAFRTEPLQRGFAEAAREAGIRLHDHNRKGEKGFFYLAPGFTTTPEGEAMRTFFRARGDEATAAHFHDSSMEFVQRLGGDPLCLVTELPLFVVEREGALYEPGVPTAYLAFKERLPEWKLRLQRGEAGAELLDGFRLRPLDLATAVRLQLRALELGLETVR